MLSRIEGDGHDRFHRWHPFTAHNPPALGCGLRRHAETTEEGRNHIVGMPFDINCQLEQLFAAQGLSDQCIGSHQACHDCCGTTAKPSSWGHRQTHTRFKSHWFFTSSFPDPLGGSINEVVGATP